jgi:hypothetical protein
MIIVNRALNNSIEQTLRLGENPGLIQASVSARIIEEQYQLRSAQSRWASYHRGST